MNTWVEIAVTLIGIVLSVEFINNIRFRKSMKRMKANEATDSDTATQEKQINLAELYLDKVMKLTEGGFEQLGQKVDNLTARLGNIEEYLNGDYQRYLMSKK